MVGFHGRYFMNLHLSHWCGVLSALLFMRMTDTVFWGRGSHETDGKEYCHGCFDHCVGSCIDESFFRDNAKLVQLFPDLARTGFSVRYGMRPFLARSTIWVRYRAVSKAAIVKDTHRDMNWRNWGSTSSHNVINVFRPKEIKSVFSYSVE